MSSCKKLEGARGALEAASDAYSTQERAYVTWGTKNATPTLDETLCRVDKSLQADFAVSRFVNTETFQNDPEYYRCTEEVLVTMRVALLSGSGARLPLLPWSSEERAASHLSTPQLQAPFRHDWD